MKTLEKDHEVNLLPNVDDGKDIEEENLNEQTFIEENKIVSLDLNSSIEEDHSVTENKIETLEDDVELLEVVNETLDRY